MAFSSRFQVILRLRKAHRDLRQQSVVDATQNCDTLKADRDRLVQERACVLNDLRRLINAEAMDVRLVLTLQRHAEQVGQELEASESAVMEAAARLDACLAQLIEADQSVKILERLSERQFLEHELAQERFAARELDEVAATRHWYGS